MNLSNKTKIPYAFSNIMNYLVGVDEVSQGLSCNCFCPSCGMRLEARQGEIRTHHFSHHDKATIGCNYSYWVSIRDLAKQILRELKYIQCKNIPNEYKEAIKKKNAFYELELFEEKKLQDKHGMDIFFTSNIGLIGILLLTPEKRGDKESKTSNYIDNHHVLELDLTSVQNMQSYTVSALRDIIENPDSNSFIFSSSGEESSNFKEQENYVRLYKAKSIMNMEDFRAMKLNTILINSFCQSDFSAINVAKLYYKNMFERFKNIGDFDACKEIDSDGMHSFYQCKNQYYAVAEIQSKYHIYQVVDDKITLIDKCFKKEKIAQILTDFLEKIDAKNTGFGVINKYPTLF